MSAPKVSIVIPCFNYAQYVEAAIASVLGQTGVDIEVIVVDDASTDDSAAVVAAVERADPRVRLVRHHNNTGPVRTFNDGLALASGEFLVRLDADDLLTPGSLERAVRVMEHFSSVGLVYGRPVHFLTAHPPRARRPRPTVVVWTGSDWLSDRCRSGVNVITSPEVMMRMSVVGRVGGQRELAHTHDMEMWMRIAAVSDVAYIRGADQAWHREHGSSLSTRADDALGLTMLRERLDAFDTLSLEPFGGVALDGRFLRQARRTLAREAIRRAAYEYDRGRAPGRSVSALVEFAVETDPGSCSGPSWAGLLARIAAGDQWRRARPWLLLRPLQRMARDWVGERRWRRTGLYDRMRSGGMPCLDVDHKEIA